MTEPIKSSLQIADELADENAIHTGYINGDAGTLYVGQEVYVSGDNTVRKRLGGTTLPVGVCTSKTATGEIAVIGLAKSGVLAYAKAIGSAITAGTPIVPNGNAVLDAKGNVIAIEYVLAVPGDNYMTIAQTGAAENGIFKALNLTNFAVLA
jgi:hypothetical protein